MGQLVKQQDDVCTSYDWDANLRGYRAYEYPVSLEPALQYPPFLKKSTPAVDDGKRESFFSTIFKKEAAVEVLETQKEFPQDLEPNVWAPMGELDIYRLHFARDHDVRLSNALSFLSSLDHTKDIVSFEVVATGEGITLQFALRDHDSAHVKAQWARCFPTAKLIRSADALEDFFCAESQATSVLDFGLSEASFLPLASLAESNSDPLGALLAAVSTVEDGACVALQVMSQRLDAFWNEALTLAAEYTYFRGGEADSFALCRKKALEKSASSLHAVAIRVVASAKTPEQVAKVIERTANALSVYSAHNSLIPLLPEGYPQERLLDDVRERRTHRTGMVLSTEELAGFVHPPHQSVAVAGLWRGERTEIPFTGSENESTLLGINLCDAEERTVSVSDENRLAHMHVVGGSGTGKTTFLHNCIIQDMANGHGVMLLDPHGDLFDDVLKTIPPERREDVVIIDPSDPDYAVAFNVLEAHSESERLLLAEDVVSIFKRLSTSWGDQLHAVLSNALLAITSSESGGTLFTLRRFLAESSFRSNYLQTVRDSEVVYYWQHEFPLLPKRAIAPVLTRLNSFLRPETIRMMVGQKDNALDFRAFMDEGKIVLIKLPLGAIGESNAHLLGSLFIARLNQMALGRENISKNRRKPFFAYIDEFQNFLTPTLAQTLSGVRKYGVGLALAHQSMQQLKSDADVFDSVLANPSLKVCFRTSERDARILVPEFKHASVEDFMALGRGEALGRIGHAGADFSVQTFPPQISSSPQSTTSVDELVQCSNARYATKRGGIKLIDSSLDVPPAAATQGNRGTVARGSVGMENAPINDDEPAPHHSVAHDLTDSSRLDENVEPSVSFETVVSETKGVEQEGRGGVEHKYLQGLISRLAHERGYGAVIEERTKDGGWVDVALTSNNMRIACEISISTPNAHEVRNIRKCLGDGYDIVLAVVQTKRAVRAFQKHLSENLNDDELAKVKVVEPVGLLNALEEYKPKEHKSVRGYRVEVGYAASSDEDMERRANAIAKIIAKGMRGK